MNDNLKRITAWLQLDESETDGFGWLVLTVFLECKFAEFLKQFGGSDSEKRREIFVTSFWRQTFNWLDGRPLS